MPIIDPLAWSALVSGSTKYFSQKHDPLGHFVLYALVAQAPVRLFRSVPLNETVSFPADAGEEAANRTLATVATTARCL